MLSMLSAHHIKKKYGPLDILRGVSLEIAAGELVSIVGASGAGKSTLLHILGTLETADEGSLTINEVPIANLKGKKLSDFRNQHIGFIFQFHHLLPEFTALENVCIPGWIAGKGKKELEKNGMELLDLLGLSSRVHHKPAELSGGEQQRVAVARALINRPSIVFADEPTGNLDSQHALELYRLFLDLRARFKQTFLVVTHNEALASLSDRKLVMKDGLLLN